MTQTNPSENCGRKRRRSKTPSSFQTALTFACSTNLATPRNIQAHICERLYTYIYEMINMRTKTTRFNKSNLVVKSVLSFERDPFCGNHTELHHPLNGSYAKRPLF